MKLWSLFLLFSLTINLAFAQGDTTVIDFGRQPNMPSGAIALNPIGENGKFGWDFGSDKIIIPHDDGVIATSPVYFSFQLPEGCYKISVLLGSNHETTKTTIKAESRRLFIKNCMVARGETKEVSFLVNVHNKKVSDTIDVFLKEREIRALNWDDKLTLEFLGNLGIKSIKVMLVDVPHIFLAGDSTVTDQDLAPWASWGQMFSQYLSEEVCLANYASSGASLHSFRARNRLAKIISQIKKGDFVLIEFSHNDEKRKGENIGPWSSFSQLLREYASKIKAKGGNPILITPIQRRKFASDGKLVPTHGMYPKAIRSIAQELKIPLIDLTKMTTQMFEAWGPETSKKAFVHYAAHTFPNQDKKLEDNTHFNNFGAHEIALAMVQAIKDQKLMPHGYFKKDIAPYNAFQPNLPEHFELTMSNRFENKKPYGN